MLSRVCAFVMILAAASNPLAAAGLQLDGPVGQWGDPARIHIEGAQQLDPQKIKEGLSGNFQHFMASHPSAPLAGLAKSVQLHLLRGCRHAGFGEATVDVRLDESAQQVVVDIDEGQRRHAGAIHVEGPPNIRELLTDLLGQRRAPAGATPTELSDYGGVIAWADADGKKVEQEEPLWVPGQPAHLDGPAADARQKRVQQSLADLGFDQAQFESSVTTVGPLAEWQIRIDDLGPPAILRTIETKGNQRNTHEEIVAHLNLRPGPIVTREFRQRIQRSLWNSARFLSSKVEAERLADGSGVTLQIEVQEYPQAPSLSAQLSREEQALMKHRHWMVHGPGSQMDIVVTVTRPNGHMEIILSPVEGLSSCWWPSADDAGLPEFVLLATDEQLAAYSTTSGRLLSAPLSSVQLNANLTITVNDDDPDHAFKTNFGFGIETLDRGETRSPLTLTTSMPPVFFLAQAHEQSECTWEGNVLALRSKRGTLRIHERTGEMVEYVSAEDDGTSFGYAFQRQAFARRKHQMATASAGTPNDFEGTRPVSSVAGFFLNTGIVSRLGGVFFGEDFAEQMPQDALAVLGKLADHGFLSIADAILVAMNADEDEPFKIPFQENPAQQFQAMHFYGFLVAQGADRVFPRDSWAWTLWRESSLVVAGIGQHAGSELNKLMADPRCGPSSYWLLAELLQAINQPVAPIAQQGLRKFNREAFIREWESALGADLHPTIALTLESLRSLSDDDVATLMALVDGPQPNWIRIAAQLRAAGEPRAGDATTDLLGSIWATDLRARLQQRLQQLAMPPRVSERTPNIAR